MVAELQKLGMCRSLVDYPHLRGTCSPVVRPLDTDGGSPNVRGTMMAMHPPRFAVMVADWGKCFSVAWLVAAVLWEK